MARDKEHPALGRPSWLMQVGFIEYEEARRLVSRRIGGSALRRWRALNLLRNRIDAEFAKGVCFFYSHEIHQWFIECAKEADWQPYD